MNGHYLSIGSITRRFSTGATEALKFEPGVNLLVGRSNTGKTKWLQTLDYILGDRGANPFENAQEEGLAEKYDTASCELLIGGQRVFVERRWRETGAKSKVFVDDEAMTARDFQHFLMEKLGIPLLNFPKGNPMSGQTWPELSFRMLLRHIYRQQRFWNDLADKQPEGEQYACILQFLGLAEHLFSEDYGQLLKLRMEVERLRARRDQFGQTLDDLVSEVLSEPGLTVGVSVMTVRNAENRILSEMDALRQRRDDLISDARDETVSPEDRGHVLRLSEKRAAMLVAQEQLRHKAKATTDRREEMGRYHTDLAEELDRLTRTEDAGAVLADLRITHCPACDQPVVNAAADTEHCFLCHQQLSEGSLIEELGAVRLRFEVDRLGGELKEAEELLSVLKRDAKRLANEIKKSAEHLRMLENELAPAREAVAAFVQEEVSAIDMALGELNERQRHLGRISAALESGQELSDRIKEIEQEIEPLQARVDEAARSTDFGAAAALLEDGMNAYLQSINLLRPGVWLHSPIRVDVSRYSFAMKVGSSRWDDALGGTDSLYFLMAYHYGLLTLSDKSGCHYPGLSIIDVPGEFSGEAIGDKENFIVQPFINLLSQEEYEGTQLIITGVSFERLDAPHRLYLTHVYVS